jgi:outer membrane protein OmpA-like peptidoglycan-associated protein
MATLGFTIVRGALAGGLLTPFQPPSKSTIEIFQGVFMKLILRCMLVAFGVFAITSTAFGQDDVAGSKDYPGITRMPGYFIYDYQETAFGSLTFNVKEGTKEKEQAVEGHRYDFRYNLKDGATMPSPLQILRNYQNAARTAGGQVLFTGEDTTTLRLTKAGKEAWVAVHTSNAPSGMFITMNIVEKEGMKQDVVMDAAAMAGRLTDTGSVAVYGIYFDTAKSELKPESDAALGEIAKLLKEHPALKVFIVGHTDMMGDPATNMRLSQARAQSIVNALVARNAVAGSRLTPFGAGSYAPVATNKTEEGRAKNRRVELVEIATQ